MYVSIYVYAYSRFREFCHLSLYVHFLENYFEYIIFPFWGQKNKNAQIKEY